MTLSGQGIFRSYQQSLQRIMFTEMIDAHMQAQQARRLSIVGPCHTHDQWLAAHAEREARRAAAADTNPTPRA